MADSDPAPLHRSTEIEDLTHLTEKDKEHIAEDVEATDSSIHRSPEVEDLAHISPQDLNKPSVDDHSQLHHHHHHHEHHTTNK